MTNPTNENPYPRIQGYEDNHNFAINGYGITINTIKSWLYDKQLNTTPVGYERATKENAEDTMPDDFDNYLTDHNTKTSINYVTTSTAEFSGIMCYSVEPQVAETTVPAIEQVEKDIVEAIELLYVVPDKLHADLKRFVEEYAGYISVCDFS